MKTCTGCGKRIEYREMAHHYEKGVDGLPVRVPVMKWAVDPAEKNGLPTYVCKGARGGGGGWTIEAYHEPEDKT